MPLPHACARLATQRIPRPSRSRFQRGMGIPFFYRWLVERYPAASRPVTQNGISVPPIDNLFLDMNGIVHTNTHGNNGAAVFEVCRLPPAPCAFL